MPFDTHFVQLVRQKVCSPVAYIQPPFCIYKGRKSATVTKNLRCDRWNEIAILLKQRRSKCSSLLLCKKLMFIYFVCIVRLLMQLTVIFCHLPSQAKVLSGGRRLGRSASRRPPVSEPFLCLTASLGSVTDTLTLKGEYAYANDLKSGWGLDWSCQRLAPRWPWTNYGRDELWLVGCLGSEPEPRLALSQTRVKRCLSGALVKPPRPGEGIAGRALTLHPIPWNLPYNWGKIMEKPQSGYPKGAQLTSTERDLFSRLGHHGRWPQLACWPLPPLVFASGDGVNPRSA
jgi:hypothetical protein